MLFEKMRESLSIKNLACLFSLLLFYHSGACAAEGTGMYVINHGSNSVSIIDVTTNTVNNTISLSYSPQNLCMGGTGMYIGNSGKTMTIIDINNHNKSTITLQDCAQSFGVAGSKMYMGGKTGVTVNEMTNLQSSYLPFSVGAGNAAAFALCGTDMYVACSDYVIIINTTNQQMTNLSVPGASYDLALAGTGMYVANGGGDAVNIIDTNNHNISSIDMGQNSNPASLALAGTGMYVTKVGSNEVAIIDVTNQNVSTIAVGQNPWDLILAGTGMYVTNMASNTVTIIDTINHHTTTLSVGDSPMTLSKAGTGVYVVNQGSNNVSIIDTTNQQVTTVPVGTTPYYAALDNSTSYPNPTATRSLQRSAGLFGNAGFSAKGYGPGVRGR